MIDETPPRAVGRRELAALLSENEATPKRSLGQNFLVDPNFARKIAELCVQDSPRVLEIGAGAGSLTVMLASYAEVVLALEKDAKMCEMLLEVLQRRAIANVELIAGDAMNFDFETAMNQRGLGAVVGNLPYNISVPLIMNLIDDTPSALKMTFLVQSEVADRICARPGIRQSSYVSLKTQFYCDTKIVLKVPNTVFLPIPNVSSSVVTFRRHSRHVDAYGRAGIAAALIAARIAFGHRRQMLRRTLPVDRFGDAYAATGLDPSRRPENVELEEWAQFGRAIQEQGDQSLE